MIELLTVMAIIGLLAGLIFPAVNSAIKKSKFSKAQNDCIQLATVFRTYQTDYGKWPVSAGTNFVLDSSFRRLLQGDQYITNSPFQGNPRRLVYMNFNPKELDASGSLVDPWGRPYWCKFDATGSESVPNPFDSSATIAKPLVVWSLGSDGLANTAGENSAVNRDNPRSW